MGQEMPERLTKLTHTHTRSRERRRDDKTIVRKGAHHGIKSQGPDAPDEGNLSRETPERTQGADSIPVDIDHLVDGGIQTKECRRPPFPFGVERRSCSDGSPAVDDREREAGMGERLPEGP
jgi:hypothetical protein